MAQEGNVNHIMRATLALNPEEAYNGTERTLTLPGGRHASLRVPPRATTGQEIRLAGQGEIGVNGVRGDLVITLTITTQQVHRGASIENEDPNAATFISSHIPPTQRANAYPKEAGPLPPTQRANTYPGEGEALNQQRFSTTTVPDYASPTPPAPPPISQNPPYYQPQIPLVPPAPPVQPAGRKPLTLFILLGLAVIVLIGGGILAYATVIAPNNANSDPTAVAQTNATATAQARNSATANAVATNQAQQTATQVVIKNATATAVAVQMAPYNEATKGTPDLNDSLQDQSSTNWDTSDNCTFTDKAYHIHSAKGNTFFYCASDKINYKDFAFQIHFTLIKGDSAGFIFRADNNYKRYYLFTIDAKGNYALYKYDDNAEKSSTIIERSKSDALKVGLNQENVIAMIAKGNSFEFYFNQQYGSKIVDPAKTYMSSGHLGLIALDNTKETEVAYTQAQFWKL